MYRHFKAKHDPATYQKGALSRGQQLLVGIVVQTKASCKLMFFVLSGLVARLEEKLRIVAYRQNQEKFGVVRWTAKKERLEIKLARALGITPEEVV